MISLLKEIKGKILQIQNWEYYLTSSNFEEEEELQKIMNIFPDFNYHNHYYGKLYKCYKCNENVTIDKICYISVEMFQVEYYYCMNCTSD